MVDCTKCKHLYLEKTGEYTARSNCKLGMLLRKDDGFDMPKECSGFEQKSVNNLLDRLREEREEKFKKIGQYMLQKYYYENKIKNLLIAQEDLCNKIFNLERDNNAE